MLHIIPRMALIIITIGIGGLVTFYRSNTERTWHGLRLHLLPPALLSHPSAHADILFYISRRITKLIWTVPTAMTAATGGVMVHHGLMDLLRLPATAPGHMNLWLTIGFTLSLVLSSDLAYYLYHRAQHANAILWEFHKVHHSAERLVGTTDGRVHPLDEVMFATWEALFSGVLYGLWLFVDNDPIELTVLGMSGTFIAETLSFRFVHHLPYRLSFGWFNHIFISPHYHQLHHSVNPAHYNRNFGVTFVFWDKLFGTLTVPKPDEDFTYGLSDNEAADYQSLSKLYIVVFIKLARLAFNWHQQKATAISAVAATTATTVVTTVIPPPPNSLA